MRVLFATADSNGPQGWWRCHVPAAMLRSRGHEAFSAPALTVDDKGRLRAVGTRQQLRPAQVVVLQGWFHGQAPDLIRQARKAGQVVFCDLDDDVWHIPSSNPAYEAAQQWRPHLEAILEQCDGVLCSTPAITETAGAFNDNVWVCRNGVPSTMINRGGYRWRDVDVTDGRTRIGLVGRTSFRGDDFTLVADALHACNNMSDIVIVHYGAVDDDPSLQDTIGHIPCDILTREWCHVEQFVLELADVDLVLLPQVLSPFAEARSNATGLLCAAAGVQFLATATSEYRRLSADHIGVTVDNTEQWRTLVPILVDAHQGRSSEQPAVDALAEHDAEHTIRGWCEAMQHHLTVNHERRDTAKFIPRGVRGRG
jgi:hypothetical protein